jgi:hypothetical protein
LPLFVLLTAFSNGCTALTGVEAVSNWRPRLQAAGEPERRRDPRRDGGPRNHDVHRDHAARARVRNRAERCRDGRLADCTRHVRRAWLAYYAVQAATMAILVLAANTAYADFPRLASIMARDRFLPRQFMNQGDRLAFSNGILILSVLASVLLVVFEGDTHALIPLYMIGVFVSFTLSQAGMVMHWRCRASQDGNRVLPSMASAPSSPESCWSSSP